MAKTEEGQLKEDCKKIFEANGFYYRAIVIGAVPGRKNPSAGIPDAVVIRNSVTAFVEFKAPKGKLREEQETFIFQWTAHGGLVFVVRSIEDCQEVIRKIKLIKPYI